MISGLLLWASKNDSLRRRLPRYRFFRRAVARFMPGEEPEAALAEGEKLQRSGIATVFTLLGENLEKPEDAEAVVRHYGALLEEARRRKLDGEISVKLTQLGLDLSPELAQRHVAGLAQEAERLGSGLVWIDMEESRYVDSTLGLFRELLKSYANVGLCLQAYLYRTKEDLQTLLPLTGNIRLVKGAYLEPKEIAFPKKRDVDQNYFRLAGRILDGTSENGGRRPAFATHDDRLIRKIQQLASERRIDKSSFEFQMLYGIRPALQEELAQNGHRLRVLISYGDQWFPWYMRRLAERPANLWFLLKNIWRS